MQQQSDFSLDVWLLKGVLFLALAALIVVSLPLWIPFAFLWMVSGELRDAWPRGPSRVLLACLWSLPLSLAGLGLLAWLAAAAVELL